MISPGDPIEIRAVSNGFIVQNAYNPMYREQSQSRDELVFTTVHKLAAYLKYHFKIGAKG